MQDIAAAREIWLIDHALSFAEVSDAVSAMRAHPHVLQRIADILEISCQVAALPDETDRSKGAEEDARTRAAAAGDGVAAAEEDAATDVSAAAEPHASGMGGDALMQQVVARLHEIVYEVVFQESADTQRRTRKHRQAHLGKSSIRAVPAWPSPVVLLGPQAALLRWPHGSAVRPPWNIFAVEASAVGYPDHWRHTACVQQQAVAGFGLRYIMDELGSRIRASSNGKTPGLQLAPFAWQNADGRTEMLSLLWALRDVAESEAATCAGRLGMADYSSQAYW